MVALLDAYTALDLTDMKGQLCGRVLADLGMNVIKVEPVDGDPGRASEPFQKFSDGSVLSLEFAHLNANKKSKMIDLREESGRIEFHNCAAKVDVILENYEPGYLDALGISYQNLVPVNPALVMASITCYGQTGSRANFSYSDIVAFAMSGLMYITGDPRLPPCNAPESQGYYFGSLFGALGVLAALERRKRTGQGDHVDVSMQEALATQEQIIRVYANENVILKRAGSQHANVAPANTFPCSDGYVYLYINRQHWKTFLQLWTDHPSQFDGPEWEDNGYRRARADQLNTALARFTLTYSKAQLTDLFQSRGVPCMPVNRAGEFVADSQTQQRQFLTTVTYPDHGELLQVTSPFTINGNRLGIRPAPQFREHQDELGESPNVMNGHNWGLSTLKSTTLPLSGTRILAFDHILAGPYATTLLAELGAEVIKVESRRGGLDPFRYFGATQDPDMSPRFLEFNRNKRSITINLKHHDGPKLIKELIPHCDVVLDNFSVRVMPSLGLGYDDLSRINPAIIVLRMPSLGSTGPKSGFAGVGSTITAFTGITYLWNHERHINPPVGSQGVYPDYVSGLFAAITIVSAIHSRSKTGQGVCIDISQAEAAAFMIGRSLMQSVNLGEEAEPIGNRSLRAAPQGCYRCKGEDRWVVISVENDEQWRALATALKREELCQDECFRSSSGRRQYHDDLDRMITAWTSDRDCYDVMAALTNMGVPAGVVQNGADLLSDEHLKQRGFLVHQDNPRLGRITLPAFPLKFANCTLQRHWHFPKLGLDTGTVLHDLLGYNSEQIASMVRDGLLE